MRAIVGRVGLVSGEKGDVGNRRSIVSRKISDFGVSRLTREKTVVLFSH